jgi:clan AA aspartic protease (TIGR02281 family)
VIALNESSAARFGLRPSSGDYNATVTTANGKVRAARTRLAMVDIGGLVVRDVDAMVLPDEALSENLLGLSFLSRLKRFEYANGQMVLEQYGSFRCLSAAIRRHKTAVPPFAWPAHWLCLKCFPFSVSPRPPSNVSEAEIRPGSEYLSLRIRTDGEGDGLSGIRRPLAVR